MQISLARRDKNIKPKVKWKRKSDEEMGVAEKEEAEGMNLFAQRRGNVIHWLHPHHGQLRKCRRYTQIAFDDR